MRTGRIITRSIAIFSFIAALVAGLILLLAPAGIGRAGIVNGHVRGFRLILGSKVGSMRFTFNVVGIIALMLIGIGGLAAPMRQNVTAGVISAVTFVAAGVLIYGLLGLTTVTLDAPVASFTGSATAHQLYYNGWGIKASGGILFVTGLLSALRIFFRD